jgi:hypothetical protein
MIRAVLSEADGRWQLTIEGHAEPSVCAAVTAMEQSVAIWLEQFAELLPAALTFNVLPEEAS